MHSLSLSFHPGPGPLSPTLSSAGAWTVSGEEMALSSLPAALLAHCPGLAWKGGHLQVSECHDLSEASRNSLWRE